MLANAILVAIVVLSLVILYAVFYVEIKYLKLWGTYFRANIVGRIKRRREG